MHQRYHSPAFPSESRRDRYHPSPVRRPRHQMISRVARLHADVLIDADGQSRSCWNIHIRRPNNRVAARRRRSDWLGRAAPDRLPGNRRLICRSPMRSALFAGNAAAGVTVVVTACAVCPGTGGCTVVVVTLPFLSVETTCWACPVAAACFFALSIAASCFDWQPTKHHQRQHHTLPQTSSDISKRSSFGPLSIPIIVLLKRQLRASSPIRRMLIPPPETARVQKV